MHFLCNCLKISMGNFYFFLSPTGAYHKIYVAKQKNNVLAHFL